ncbi:hypothetical protein PGT21_016618 [Puccinia graminis f. sp. tritici]|uniref:Uncharacterized protein n=1 Tax=Puccinia graminis f. sp. tritici TaxID=56615 RepID=A0A5B0PDR2_PUCGR|nr:hypothetical protein PGTUg99_004931 [Puccinia graminis f. sp. tritici]KAA1105715.1 hypothetical protein PGT21_016618 [Puccinia graminis f. sp. tritici]
MVRRPSLLGPSRVIAVVGNIRRGIRRMILEELVSQKFIVVALIDKADGEFSQSVEQLASSPSLFHVFVVEGGLFGQAMAGKAEELGKVSLLNLYPEILEQKPFKPFVSGPRNLPRPPLLSQVLPAVSATLQSPNSPRTAPSSQINLVQSMQLGYNRLLNSRISSRPTGLILEMGGDNPLRISAIRWRISARASGYPPGPADTRQGQRIPARGCGFGCGCPFPPKSRRISGYPLGYPRPMAGWKGFLPASKVLPVGEACTSSTGRVAFQPARHVPCGPRD